VEFEVVDFRGEGGDVIGDLGLEGLLILEGLVNGDRKGFDGRWGRHGQSKHQVAMNTELRKIKARIKIS